MTASQVRGINPEQDAGDVRGSPVRPFTFFALTYLLSWLLWLPLVLGHFNVIPLVVSPGLNSIIGLLGVLMPSTAALVLTARAGGRALLKRLFRRLRVWRVGWVPWVAVVLVQPLLLVLTGEAFNASGGLPPVQPVQLDSAAVLLVNVFFLLLATLGEEIGWRGVALPGLQERHSAVGATAVLGLVWATWHLPYWLLIGTLEQFGLGYFVLNYAFVFPLTVFITWCFNHGRGSLLLPVVFHLVFNTVNVAWLPVTASPGAFAWLVAAEWAIALVLLPRLEPTRAVQLPAPDRRPNQHSSISVR